MIAVYKTKIHHVSSRELGKIELLAVLDINFARGSATFVLNPSPSFPLRIVLYHFFGGNLGSPIPVPLSLTPRTLSIAPSTFWSGAAVPLSKSCTIVTVVLHLVARSFCVIFGWISFRRFTIACPTSRPMVLGLTISSERSTLVRCCPSTDGF
jgi:hypothetical protein